MLKWYAKKLGAMAGRLYSIEHNGIFIFYDEGVEDSVEYRLFIQNGPRPSDRQWIARLPKFVNKIVGDSGVKSS